jgi:hypothetical protein
MPEAENTRQPQPAGQRDTRGVVTDVVVPIVQAVAGGIAGGAAGAYVTHKGSQPKEPPKK